MAALSRHVLFKCSIMSHGAPDSAATNHSNRQRTAQKEALRLHSTAHTLRTLLQVVLAARQSDKYVH